MGRLFLCSSSLATDQSDQVLYSLSSDRHFIYSKTLFQEISRDIGVTLPKTAFK